jgi:CheY-like chemotaxis protein
MLLSLRSAMLRQDSVRAASLWPGAIRLVLRGERDADPQSTQEGQLFDDAPQPMPTASLIRFDHLSEARSSRASRKRGWQQSPIRVRTRLWTDGIAAGHSALAWRACDHQPMRTSVLIVDDHDGFRESASALLEAEGFAVVGTVADGEAAFVAVERLRPDVVLLDVQLPDSDGFALAERLAAAPDPPKVVLISSREAAAYGPRLLAAPARGFISKRDLTGAALRTLVA